MDCSPPGSLVYGESPGKNTGLGCRALLQGMFPTQESNWDLQHCRQILYQLSYHGSPQAMRSSQKKPKNKKVRVLSRWKPNWSWPVILLGFPCSLVGKDCACSARDPGSIPGSGRSREKEMATHSSILAWRIPWTEEPGGLQSMELQESDTT